MCGNTRIFFGSGTPLTCYVKGHINDWEGGGGGGGGGGGVGSVQIITELA